MKLHSCIALLAIFLLTWATEAYAGDTAESTNNGDNGAPNCPAGSCPTPEGNCKDGEGNVTPATNCDSNPIDVRTGNKYHAEPLFQGAGEMPPVNQPLGERRAAAQGLANEVAGGQHARQGVA